MTLRKYSPSILDFVPLVKTLRCYENDLSSKQKPTRGQAAQELLANYSWPIGEGGYRTFRHYSGAAETAGFVFLGTCKFGPTIRSTGRLESLLNSKSNQSCLKHFASLLWFRSPQSNPPRIILKVGPGFTEGDEISHP